MQNDLSTRHQQAVADAAHRANREFRAEAALYFIASVAVAVYLFVHMGGLQAPSVQIVVTSVGGALVMGLFAYWLLKLLLAAIVTIVREYLPQLRK